jgi:hypothetical protein
MRKAYTKPMLHEQIIAPTSHICGSNGDSKTRFSSQKADDSEVLIKRRSTFRNEDSSNSWGSLWDDNE